MSVAQRQAAPWWQRIPQPWLWVLVGVSAVGLVLFVLWWGPWLLTRQNLSAVQRLKAENDIRTTLVQAVAGVAVASGAVVTYRAFRHTRLEQDRTYRLSQSQQVTETYAWAVEQLGHQEAPVRLGAMYSLERLGQDDPPRRQTVIDILCSYLRMPYVPPASRGSMEQGRALRVEAALPAIPAQVSRNADQELQVRLTAQRLLQAHLRPPAGFRPLEAQNIEASPERVFWPGIILDLTGATLVDLDFSNVSVGAATFVQANFTGSANFNGAAFGSALFYDATFSHRVSFEDAYFSMAVFNGATFQDFAEFQRATFVGPALFLGATFVGAAWFSRMRFLGTVHFTNATFSGHASFRESMMIGAEFFGVTFADQVSFAGAALDSSTAFRAVRVLHIDDPALNEKDGDPARVWPYGWTVVPDARDPSQGTLARHE